MPNPSTATTGAASYVTVTTTSALKVSADPSVTSIRLRNTDSTNSVWYSYSTPATTGTAGTSVELAAGKEVSLPYNGNLWIISSSASVVLLVEKLKNG